MAKETEVKIRLESADGMALRLEEIGARLAEPRHFEDNRIFDLPGDMLARSGRLLRVREAAGRVVVTAKGPADPAAQARGYKSRPENEIEVDDAAQMVAVLRTVGFSTSWRYQKWRREYSLDGASIVLDELPHGDWMEIEGASDLIEAIAGRLGCDRAEFRALTYRDVHAEWCATQGIEIGDMVFGGGPEETA